MSKSKVNYPNEPEYDTKTRNSVEKALGDIFIGSCEFNWYKQNDYRNYHEKIDLLVTVTTKDKTSYNLQGKITNYKNTFSVSKKAIEHYLTRKLVIDGLFIGIRITKELILVDWYEFINFVRKEIKSGRLRLLKNEFYIINISDLKDNCTFYEENDCDL